MDEKGEKPIILREAMKKNAIILIGLQASGKSTCYQRMWKDDYVHINLDTLHTRKK